MGVFDTLRSAASAAGGAALDAIAKAKKDEEGYDEGYDEDVAAAQGAKNPPDATDPGATAVALGKAPAQAPAEIGDPTADPQAIFWDPFAVIDSLGYKERPASVSFDTLQAMTIRMPIVQAIIKRRTDQCANFSEPQEDKFQTGYRVALRDKKAKPTPASEKRSQEIQNWLRTTGKVDEKKSSPNARDNFETFLRKTTRDSLIYDQSCFEVVHDRKGLPHSFYAVDAKTIRIADTTRLNFSGTKEEIRYAQVYDGLVVAEYPTDTLSFGVRNPVTDIRNQGYGFAETEALISTVTSLLWAWDYNQKFFSQGTSSKGILNFKGAVPERQLRSFRRHWYSMVAGVENAFKTPIVAAEELQYIDLAKSNKDMEFSAWFDFLIKVTCAIYGMDPMEINFKYGDSGGASSMFESNNTQKLTASKDAGLKPLLRFHQSRINSYLIQPLDPDFELQFVGLEAQSPAELADLNTKLVKTYKTVNEVRAEEDLAPLPDGDIILDPVFMQAKQMAAQQEAGVGEFAEDDEEEDPFGAELDGLQDNDDDGDVEADGPDTQDGPPGGDPAKPAGPPTEKSLRRRKQNMRKSVGSSKTSTAVPGIVSLDLDL